MKDLSEKLEAGIISPSDCLKTLNELRHERILLKERCEAMQMLQRIEWAQERRKSFEKDPVRADAFLQLKDAWRNCRTLTNQNVIEAIKYTKAYESGLLNEDTLSALNIETETLTEAMINLKKIIK